MYIKELNQFKIKRTLLNFGGVNWSRMSALDRYVWDQEQKQKQKQKQQQQEPRKKSKLALLLLASRVTTLVSLAISIVILKNTNKTYTDKLTVPTTATLTKMDTESATPTTALISKPSHLISSSPCSCMHNLDIYLYFHANSISSSPMHIIWCRYMMFIMVVGCVHNLLQIPLALYYFFREKHLINRRRFVLFQFFADQVI